MRSVLLEIIPRFMKTINPIFLSLFIIMILASFISSSGDEKDVQKVNFYQKSLHATNKGIEFIYSKENGGIERLVGKSAQDIGCIKSICHATTCDDCHLKEFETRKSYSSDSVTINNACKKCHGDLAKDNSDVHFAKGMKCMNCHTSKEIHGDGTENNTYMYPGFFDVKCENCHKSISEIKSHTVHGNKLDCQACHTDEYSTCLNCHIDNRLKNSKEVQVLLKNMTFLINHNGKVTIGNMLSYVYQGRTMITFAKNYPHSIKKQGRKCLECHKTRIIREIQENKFKLVWWEKDSLRNAEGVVPVLDGYDWNLVYLDQQNGKWIPFKNPPKPLLNYSGYCNPITRQQFDKLR